MAGPDGHAAHHLAALQQLRQEPHRFTLFAALRLLEQADPSRPRLGEARRPDDEWVRVEQPPHLIFAPSDVASVDAVARGRLRVEQYGFGMFGPNGALPSHLTEHTFERRRHHEDGAISDFVNLFQHRMATLFYRAWAESDPVASHARPADDDFVRYLGALVGLFTESSLERDSVADNAKLFRAGLLASATRSADGLETLLSDYFRQTISVRQFVGGWLRVPVELRTQLGRKDGYAVLGETATLGAAAWQSQNRFEVVVGPVRFEEFLQFLPGSRALRSLRDLIRLYTSDEWSWQVRLIVQEDDAPGVSLGQVGRLGWTSWLGRKQGIASDAVFYDEQIAERTQ
jgi:type VI secretion system protein ImpH